MGDVIRRGRTAFVVCAGCGYELDGTGTCPNDCLADERLPVDLDELLREQRAASETYRRQKPSYPAGCSR